MKFAKIPVLGWAVGLIVLLLLLCWNLFRAMRIAQQRLVIEQKISDLCLKYHQQRKQFEEKTKAEIARVNQRAAVKMTALQTRKRKNLIEAETLKTTSELANRVFGK